MQSFARCIIFVAVVIGFSLHVCLFVCACVCFFGQCYLAAKCPICGGLLDLISSIGGRFRTQPIRGQHFKFQPIRAPYLGHMTRSATRSIFGDWYRELGRAWDGG